MNTPGVTAGSEVCDMLTRIIAGVLGAALLALLLWQPYTLVLASALAVLCGLAAYEISVSTGFVKSWLMQATCILAAVSVPFWLFLGLKWAVLFAVAAVLLVGVLQVFTHERQPVTHAVFAIAMTLWVAMSIACIYYLRGRPHGRFLAVWMLLIPWMSDTGAYFTGLACGKHKLCPNISPKKTVEGLIGGLLTSTVICVAGTLLYQYFLASHLHINVVAIGAITLVGAGLSVFGDLIASLIKRQADIKDFGSIMPGHGGVMDRFDSLLLTAPFVCVMLKVWPVIS